MSRFDRRVAGPALVAAACTGVSVLTGCAPSAPLAAPLATPYAGRAGTVFSIHEVAACPKISTGTEQVRVAVLNARGKIMAGHPSPMPTNMAGQWISRTITLFAPVNGNGTSDWPIGTYTLRLQCVNQTGKSTVLATYHDTHFKITGHSAEPRLNTHTIHPGSALNVSSSVGCPVGSSQVSVVLAERGSTSRTQVTNFGVDPKNGSWAVDVPVPSDASSGTWYVSAQCQRVTSAVFTTFTYAGTAHATGTT